jgi:hypothetical protein
MPPQSLPGAVKVVVRGTEGNDVMTRGVLDVFVDDADVEVDIVRLEGPSSGRFRASRGR